MVHWGGFLSHGYANSWMVYLFINVYFMEYPNIKWMITGVTRCQEPPTGRSLSTGKIKLMSLMSHPQKYNVVNWDHHPFAWEG